MAVDLFSGAGGLSLGFEQAGFDVLAAVEYDPIHAAVHAFNFPHTEMVCADISHVTAETVLRAAAKGWTAHGREGAWNQKLDVLIGGPPCQGFSYGGKQSSNDHRNWLVFQFARMVSELRPRYFVMENVPGMAQAATEYQPETRLLDTLLEIFSEAGYQVAEPQVLNAVAFGVPQERRRLFLLGARNNLSPLQYPAANTVSRTRRGWASSHNAVAPESTPSVWDAIGDLPNLDNFDELLRGDTVPLSDHLFDRMHAQMSNYAKMLNGVAPDSRNYSYPRNWDARILTSVCRTSHRPDVIARFENTAAATIEARSRFFRLHAEGVSSTLRAGTHYERGSFNAPRPIHPVYPRVISVREAARLHSLPDWFRLHWTKWHGFRQVGNSVPPLLARAVAAEVRGALSGTPTRPDTRIDLGNPSLLRLENKQAAKLFGADVSRMPRSAQRTRPGMDRRASRPETRNA